MTAASYGRILGANDRIRVGAIGTGSRGQFLLSLLKQLEGNEIVAFCDVYEPRRLEAKGKFGAANATDCVDHRDILERKDVDAVVIATPDHWHVPILTGAVRAGKDAYCEKPVTHAIEEGEGIIAAVRESQRVAQIGLQQRSWPHFAQAKQAIADGKLGQVTLIRTYWYQNHIPNQNRPSFDLAKLDWKRFLGSASDRPFDPDQFGNWRWYWDFGGGAMTDLFVHWVDVAHWYMGADAPSRATANGLRAILTQRQTPDTMSAALSYPGNALVEFDSALLGYIEGGGLMIRGPKAAMRIWRGGYSIYPELRGYSERPEPSNPIEEVKSKGDGTLDHMRNFLDCVRSRNKPNAAIEIGVSAARAGHVANLALRGSGVWTA